MMCPGSIWTKSRSGFSPVFPRVFPCFAPGKFREIRGEIRGREIRDGKFGDRRDIPQFPAGNSGKFGGDGGNSGTDGTFPNFQRGLAHLFSPQCNASCPHFAVLEEPALSTAEGHVLLLASHPHSIHESTQLEAPCGRERSGSPRLKS